MTDYYVWYDHLLEELFAMEKIELEKNPQLKSQLETEKSLFNLITAEDMTHAYELYRQSLPKISLDNSSVDNENTLNNKEENTLDDISSDHFDINSNNNLSSNKKNYLH